MKKTIITLTAGLWAALSLSAQPVGFKVCDGLEDTKVRVRLERNVSALLSEINRAQKEGIKLELSGIGMLAQARSDLNQLWDNVPFYCEDELVVEKVLHRTGGLQIRNIPLMLCPEDNRPLSDGDRYQEGVINLDGEGRIQSFHFALPLHSYRQLITDSLEVGDLQRRQQILDYVEHFRTAYNQKDMNFLQQVFSDEAIIITGKVIRMQTDDRHRFSTTKTVYKSQTKAEYLSKLQQVFDRNKYIKVNFSEIRLQRHGRHKGVYGVRLKQGYTSSTYSDEGYLFMLWDFRGGEAPRIYFRSWQPYYLDAKKTEVIPEEEIISIADIKGL